MILANRIKQLEAEKADMQAALEACVRALQRYLTAEPQCKCDESACHMGVARALARKAIASANENGDRTPASTTQVSPEQKAKP